MVKVNGEYIDAAGKSILEYLSNSSYDLKRIAVELCGEIVPKSLYEKTIISDGDVLEIVSFVGGG
ncbi:MAG: sulfur carrier protein ThiS [Ruminococcus sp.]|nr:sulfur carrier protein ThiS [Ruminococcus sp.]